MPGDDLQKFSTLRALFGYVYAQAVSLIPLGQTSVGVFSNLPHRVVYGLAFQVKLG